MKQAVSFEALLIMFKLSIPVSFVKVGKGRTNGQLVFVHQRIDGDWMQNPYHRNRVETGAETETV